MRFYFNLTPTDLLFIVDLRYIHWILICLAIWLLLTMPHTFTITCCVPNCGKTRLDGTILHMFPNPEKDPDRFRTWLYAIGGDILSLENKTIFKYRRVCHHHFQTRFHTTSNRLCANAVPTLNLPGKLIKMSETFTDADKNDSVLDTSRNATADSSISSDRKEILYYDMSGEKYLTIFNHYSYKNTKYFHYNKPPSRIGTNEDVARLTKTFKDMAYKVTCHDNMDYGDIIDKIVEISKQDHKVTSCLCFAFLTHGLKGGDLFAADRPYQFKDVTALLENGHPSLVGKPKIFFVQACRGDQVDSGRRVAIDGSEVSMNIPTHADFLILYSSVEDFVSYRDKEGSFLVQELCDVIEEYHNDWDILHIITVVQRRVGYYRTTFAPAKPSIHDKKQMPETRFSLTKLFKF